MNSKLHESKICNYENLVRMHLEETNSVCEHISALRIILDIMEKVKRKVALSTISTS